MNESKNIGKQTIGQYEYTEIEGGGRKESNVGKRYRRNSYTKEVKEINRLINPFLLI